MSIFLRNMGKKSEKISGLLHDDTAYYFRTPNQVGNSLQSELSPVLARAYRSIVESTAPLVSVKDLQLRILGVNRAYLDYFGFSSVDEVLGRHEREYLRPVESQDFVEKLLDNDLKAIALTKGEVLESEELFYSSDGQLLTLLVRRVPVYNDSDRLESIATMMLPFHSSSHPGSSAEHLVSRYFDTKMELLGAFAGGVAHDFNNLLMGILGNSQLGLADSPSDSPQWQYFKQIENVTCRAAELCRKMLLYSGKGNYEMRKLSLGDIVSETVDMMKDSLLGNMEVKFNIKEELPLVLGDSEKIRQVITNLLINGMEAVAEDGEVFVSVDKVSWVPDMLDDLHMTAAIDPGEYVCLEVRDSGCGMEKEVLQRLFDPFFSTKFTGRGLGMAEVLGIVHRHNGIIGVASEPGLGATFKVFFHACEQPVKAISPQPDTDSWRGSGTILLVDDEMMVLEVGKLLLEKIGFDVVTAVDGEDALAEFSKGPDSFCCVLLDLTMPNVDGLTAFQQMREVRPDVPIIISSGYTELEVRRRFFSYGIDAFIQKPYAFEKLVSKLQKIFERNS